MEPILQILEHLIPKKGSWVLSLKSVHCPNLTVHTSNRSQVFNTLRRLHHFGCMHQLLPNISSICNNYQSYGQYGCPQHFKIAKCLFVTNNQTIIRFSHNFCCSIAFKAFLILTSVCWPQLLVWSLLCKSLGSFLTEYRHLCMTQPNFIGHPALLGSPSAKFDTTPKTFFIAIKEFELFGRCNIVLTTPEDMRNGRKISNCMQYANYKE